MCRNATIDFAAFSKIFFAKKKNQKKSRRPPKGKRAGTGNMFFLLVLRKALLTHWGPIEGHPELSKVFPYKPLIAHKRAKHLRDHLVKSEFTSLRERDEENDLDDASLDAPILALVRF